MVMKMNMRNKSYNEKNDDGSAPIFLPVMQNCTVFIGKTIFLDRLVCFSLQMNMKITE